MSISSFGIGFWQNPVQGCHGRLLAAKVTIVAMIVDTIFIERLGFDFKMSFWCHSLDPDLADLAGKNLGFLWHFTSDCGWDHF